MPRALTTDQEVRAARMYADRMTARQIADALGVTLSGVYRALRRSGMQMRGVGMRRCPPSGVDWRPIEGFPDYRVSADGQVLSCRRGDPRLMTLHPDSDGYSMVYLYREACEPETRKVHRLVLEAFVGPCPDGMECRHLDGDKAHNVLENLCWGTPLENAADKKRHASIREGECWA